MAPLGSRIGLRSLVLVVVGLVVVVVSEVDVEVEESRTG